MMPTNTAACIQPIVGDMLFTDYVAKYTVLRMIVLLVVDERVHFTSFNVVQKNSTVLLPGELNC